jgi:hypothetical protein
MALKGDALPGTDHVLRYIRRKHVDRHDGKSNITGSGFLPRPGEGTPSVNWMERFDLPIENQIEKIRAEKRIKYERKSKLARLNVRNAIERVNEEAQVSVGFVYEPEDATADYCAHTSHSIMTGVPEESEPMGEYIGDLLRECVLGIYDPLID